MNGFPGLYNDWVAIFLMMAGFYVVISQGNLVVGGLAAEGGDGRTRTVVIGLMGDVSLE